MKKVHHLCHRRILHPHEQYQDPRTSRWYPQVIRFIQRHQYLPLRLIRLHHDP